MNKLKLRQTDNCALSIIFQIFYLTFCINVQSPFYPTDRITAIFFVICLAAVTSKHAWSVLLETELLWHSSNGSLTIISDHAGWSLRGSRKQKNMSNFWFEKCSRSFKKLNFWGEFLKQYLIVKQRWRRWSLFADDQNNVTFSKTDRWF